MTVLAQRAVAWCGASASLGRRRANSWHPDTPAGAPAALKFPPKLPHRGSLGTWAQNQHFVGAQVRADYAHQEQMNRYTWYEMHNGSVPYPGDTKVYRPNEVPGGYIPSPDVD